jgi:uncharacterized membrane protein YoaK (UPF0700 family)
MNVRRDTMLLVLTWAAGYVDAVSYLALGHVFTAMMTGNTVLLGLAIGQGEASAAFRSVIALGGFLGGVAVGGLIVGTDTRSADWSPAVTAALTVEALVLALFIATWHLTAAGAWSVLVGQLALAMGIQSAAVRCLGVPGIATTYITGTLTSLMVDLVAWVRSHGRLLAATAAGRRSADEVAAVNWDLRVGLLSGVFVMYGLGALVGGLLHIRSSPLVTVIPFIAVAAVVSHASIALRASRPLDSARRKS